MSDIYLSITETPTVVTLTNPLISSNVAQSVTVTNVVSVNVVTMPAITVQAAAPAVTTVAGTVSISNFPSTQTIAGTVTANVSRDNNFVRITDSNGDDILLNNGNVPISGTVTAALDYSPYYDDGSDSIRIGVNNFSSVAPATWLQTGGGEVPISGTVTVGNSVTVANFPANQAVSGTVTANNPSLLSFSGLSPISDSTRVIHVIGGRTGGGSGSSGYSPFGVQGGDGLKAMVNFTGSGGSSVAVTTAAQLPVAVGNSVTIGSLPDISGTVTARLQDASGNNLTSTSIGGVQRLNVSLASAATPGGSIPTFVNVYGGSDSGTVRAIAVDSSGRGVVTGTFWQSIQPTEIRIGGSAAQATNPLAVQISQGLGGAPSAVTVSLASTTVTVSALPSGALTTRFGTPATASTAFLTTAVTNTARKYLLIQNITTGANVITVGVGFVPTTTQGIQLAAGAGITFESSYIPTGAVWVLSSVTASNYTILEA